MEWITPESTVLSFCYFCLCCPQCWHVRKAGRLDVVASFPPQFSSPRLREPWYLHAAHGWKWDTWLRRNRTGTLWFLLKASASGCTLDAGAEEMAFKWWQIIRRTIKMKPSNSTVQISFPVPFGALAESFKERKESITLPWLQGEAHPSAHFCSLSWCLCQHQPGLWAASVSVCGVRCST